jgi:hypothetical protein
MIVLYLVTPKAAARQELLFNKPAIGTSYWVGGKVIETASHRSGKSLKWQVIEAARHPGRKSSKRQVIEVASHQS